ncbi:hypothetical protein MTP99_016528 [Tenebrio molitor]|nr:hypothetical protein MTP99_016528 [Tenebrio molitor]
MGVNCLLAAAVLGGFVASAVALQCYQCGQYNDGVGSITPCINETHMELKECPSLNHVYCIKYISEGSTVRDCVPKCTERGNFSPPRHARPSPFFLVLTLVTFLPTFV